MDTLYNYKSIFVIVNRIDIRYPEALPRVV